MKIRCSSCRKRFDYDVYSGICPKCGEYNRPGEEYNRPEEEYNRPEEEISRHEELTDVLSDDYIAEYQEGLESHPIADPQEKPKKKPRNKTLTAVLLVLIFAVAGGTLGFNHVYQKKLHAQKVSETQAPVKTCKMGEAFSYMAENNEYRITVDFAFVDEDPKFNLPEEYEAVMIAYHIDRNFLNNGGYDIDRYYEIAMTPYLETKSGYYLTPVSEFKLVDIKQLEDSTKLAESGLGDTFEYADGVFYYIVKKGDMGSLYIVSNDYDTEHYERGAVREIIRVEELEVLE